MDGSHHQPNAMAKTQAFLLGLTELSAKHGIGITGQPTLFLMEKEDYALSYQIDDESTVSFG